MQQVELPVSCMLRATRGDIRDTSPARARPNRHPHGQRPFAGPLRRPRGQKALSAHPPPLLTTRPGGSLQQPAKNTSAPATLSPWVFSVAKRHFRDGAAVRDFNTSSHSPISPGMGANPDRPIVRRGCRRYPRPVLETHVSTRLVSRLVEYFLEACRVGDADPNQSGKKPIDPVSQRST